jgi:hypothetical protein
MSDLSRAWHIDNLRRAWQWITSNPDGAHKSYFRQLYSTYAAADETLLEHLRDRLNRGVFQPSGAAKLYFPKPSGILRPYTLLAIEDQIVYQAMANVIAEKLFPHVRARYEKQVFGHLYAGTKSKWFYRRWSDGYKAFNTAAEDAFSKGFTWTASFDLTAFYDSIDYNVLRHMLKSIGLDKDFGVKLTDFLAEWTATDDRMIIHNHGIPQGPLSSGLIAEVVLKHFDDARLSRFDVKSFRYVDDIRMFAKREDHLRHALVALDRLSKDVGLFPQSAKINIHKITDIQDELKSVSNPIEPALTGFLPDQKELRRRLVELSPRFKVTDPTRFKFLLAKAAPSPVLLDRLWRIYEHAPHFYPQIAFHLAKFGQIPPRHALRLITEIDKQELYPSVCAAFIHASVGRMPTVAIGAAKTALKEIWKPKHIQADLSDALWRWLCQEKHLTTTQMRQGLSAKLHPWLRTRMHFTMSWDQLAPSPRAAWINASMRSKDADVALSAAWLCGVYDVKPTPPIRSVHPLAKLMLKELGIIRRADTSVCGIHLAIVEMTGKDVSVSWRKFFGGTYKRAEAQITTCTGYFKTDPSAWVNAMDVFSDLWLEALYRHHATLGTYTLGKIGSVLSSIRLSGTFPAVFNMASLIHEKRLESDLSHARVAKTKKPTKPIKFRWLKVGSRILGRAVQEIHNKGH